MNMVIKCLLAALWLLAVPWAAGGVVLCKSKKKFDGNEPSCRISYDVFLCRDFGAGGNLG